MKDEFLLAGVGGADSRIAVVCAASTAARGFRNREFGDVGRFGNLVAWLSLYGY